MTHLPIQSVVSPVKKSAVAVKETEVAYQPKSSIIKNDTILDFKDITDS